jgi:glycosyltransferase involved in cell wall biosynthesis
MISIIIPTLNEESVIAGTITKLKSGFTLPHEIIISDGKSKDRTVEIAKGLADKVIEYTDEARQTIAMGRNAGAAAADSSSEFVAFMDADCTILEPDRFFSQILKHFERDPGLVSVCTARRVFPEVETMSDRIIFDLFNDYFWFMNNVLHFNMSAGEFQMIRKSAFDGIGGYNGALVASEDVDLFMRLGKIGKVRYEKGLVIYHTGRRGHAIGWPKLLSQWFLNSIWMMAFGRAYTKEWSPIRTHDKVK